MVSNKKAQDGALSMKANIIWNSAGSLTYSLCQWVLTVLVVRLSSGYDAAGVLALAMAISNIFAPIALYKIRSYQVSDIHRETSAQEYVGFRLITLAAGFAFTMVYMLTTCSPNTYMAVTLYAVFRGGDLFIDVLHGVDQQNFRMDYCGKSMLARGVLFLTAFSVTLAISNSLELSILSMILVTFPVIIYDARCAGSLDNVKPRIRLPRAKKLALDCLPAVLGMVCCFAIATVSRQYLASVDGDAALGIYASISTPVVIIQACASYIYAPILGVFAQHYDNRDTARFTSLLLRTTVAITAAFAIGALGFSLFGDWLLALVFGNDIIQYSYLLMPALVCSGLAAYIAFLSDILVSIRKMKENLIANVAAFASCVPATVICVGIWDMNGVSFAASIAYAIGSLIMFFCILSSVRNLRTGGRLE